MKNYLIEPKAPLMFRDGRNFGADSALAETLPFPRPSTLSGALRTAWAESQGDFIYDQAGKKTLLTKTVEGPLLAEINDQGVKQVLLPAPADSVCLADKSGEPFIHRLKPLAINPDKEGTDLPNQQLMPVFLQRGNNSKPSKQAPVFWYLDKMIDWLQDDSSSQPIAANTQGISNLPVEVRTHVGINPDTQTNEISHLFQTAGLDFSERQLQDEEASTASQRGWQSSHYGLLMRFSDALPDGYRTIGGEARLAKISNVHSVWPPCPQPLKDRLSKTRFFRLVLMTPAIFANGYLPECIDSDSLQGKLGDLEVSLKAVALPRWQAGTSWDMLQGKKGKGMRSVQRLVPAGSVYWFEIKRGDASQLANDWLTSISDERKSDGYGLVVPGVWTIQTEAE